MSDVYSRPAPHVAGDDQVSIDQMLAEIRELNAAMREDQVRIDRLKAETEVLRAETKRLREDTRATLARLKGHFGHA